MISAIHGQESPKWISLFKCVAKVRVVLRQSYLSFKKIPYGKVKKTH